MAQKAEPKFVDLFGPRGLPRRGPPRPNVATRVGFALLVLFAGFSAWIGYRHTRLLYEAQEFLAAPHAVIAQGRLFLNALLDAETGARGYAVSGSEEFLEPYANAAPRIDQQLNELSALTAEDPEQQARIQLLRARAGDLVARLDQIVEATRRGDAEKAASIVRTGESKRLMDLIRGISAEMDAHESSRLAGREQQALHNYRTARNTNLLVALGTILLILAVYESVRRYERLRAAATRELAEANERFQVTLASIGDAVVVTDGAGRLVFCNEPCSELLLLDRPAIGRPVEELFDTVDGGPAVHKRSLLRRVLEQGGVHRSVAGHVVRKSDGARLPVDVTAGRISEAGSGIHGAVLVLRDMSERRARERELARLHQRFRSLVHAAAQVVWTADHQGLVREDSPGWRRLTGQTYEERQGQGWLDAIHPDEREQIAKSWEQAVGDSSSFAVECRVRRADGSYRWNAMRAVPVTEPDGTVREWVGMVRNIELRKRAEESERVASRRKDQFIALMAHELRNPLAPLRNGLEILRSGPDAQAASRVIDMMDRQLRHMVRLIDDLLDVSRIRQGKLELRHEHLDLRELLQQSADALRPVVEAKLQRLTVSLPDSPMWMRGDPVRLTQVFTNLLANATKYSAQGASIWLTTDRVGMHHSISVRDTGQGIASDLLPRIWDLFLQGGGAVERGESGLGLGLTLVKRLSELHGGSVEAHSDGPGTGSEFRVRLPIAPAAQQVASGAPPALRPEVRSLRILVIDDDEEAAESLAILLSIGGHDVRTALRGDQGLTVFASFAPELVLCDIRMPDLSGHEVARRLRGMAGERAVALVALTGFGTAADREASARAGFDAHLVKPVDPAALAGIVSDAAAITDDEARA